jgi:hypothetical protein
VTFEEGDNARQERAEGLTNDDRRRSNFIQVAVVTVFDDPTIQLKHVDDFPDSLGVCLCQVKPTNVFIKDAFGSVGFETGKSYN